VRLAALRSAAGGGRAGERRQRAECGDIERGDRHDSHYRCVGSEHPRGDLDSARIHSTYRDAAIVPSRRGEDRECLTGEGMKGVVDDDLGTMGLLSYFG
jgi:hypothetical protein